MTPPQREGVRGAEPARSSARSGSNTSTLNGSSRLLTASEVGERWQVPPAQVYRLSRDGVLPCVRIGRYRRFSPAAVEAFEQAGGGETDG